jgi:cytochrome b561
MTFGDDLGLGDDTRALLTTSHTWLGYLFALNLVWRLAWMVRGSRRSAPTVGRTLLARAAVVIIYSVLILQATTGIFIALYIAVDLPFRTLYAIVAEAHYSNYLAILMLIVLHPVAVIVTAMINGKKFMRIASSENRS